MGEINSRTSFQKSKDSYQGNPFIWQARCALRLNVNGGAIALGHPIGCAGVRITTTLLQEMKQRQAKRGLATLCISGGMGIALLVERV